MKKIKLGISTCLTGEPVRFDGQHKRDSFLMDNLGRFVEFLPLCPESECGLPTPRDAMHLVGDVDNPRLVTIKSGEDITPQMQRWIKPTLQQLAEAQLSGFIFKSKSPSSGLYRVKVFTSANSMPQKKAPACLHPLLSRLSPTYRLKRRVGSATRLYASVLLTR